SHPHMHSIQLLHNATAGGMPHGLGLLTTVASLPPKYRSRYLNIKTKCEIPLDLSVKPPSPPPVALPLPVPMAVPETSSDVPVATTFASVEPAAAEEVALPEEVAQEVVVITEKPITPPQSPDPVAAAVPIAVKRKLSEPSEAQPAAKLAKSEETAATPAKPIRVTDTAPRTAKATTTTTAAAATTSAKSTRNKATRKLKFDEETSSPVSGTIIRPLEDITDGNVQYSNGDIDPKYNIVEITEETKAELAAIKNVIGDYVCRLCRIKFDDAFGLARHRCACIVLLEYRCPECGKQFNCPANLASHRRWHKPKKETPAAKKENRLMASSQQAQQSPAEPQSSSKKASSEELPFGCAECGKKFKRAAYLRKHQQTHAKKSQPAASEQDADSEHELEQQPATTSAATAAATTTITGSFQTSVYKAHSSSSASSSHSYAGTHEDEGVYVAGAASGSHYDYEADYLSDCSSSTSSAGYGRLQIVEHGLTEEESIAAAALTNLRNCASVIQHTTMAH
ncbi:hypothetical protein KR093_000561, partial [Drosophila rubida]